MSCVTGEVGSLWQALASVPDHRRAAGKRYPLASLLLSLLQNHADGVIFLPTRMDFARRPHPLEVLRSCNHQIPTKQRGCGRCR